jgi:hypothetical protein
LTATALCAVAVLFCSSGEVPWRAMLFAAQDGKTQPANSAQKKVGDAKPAAKKEDDTAKRQFTARYAADLLRSYRTNLERAATYRADIEEDVNIGGRSFTAKGKYWKGDGRKFRLELSMTIGEGKDAVKARLLQVCDGEVLMTEQVMGKKKRYTRRNVKQILAAAAAAMQTPANNLLAEFGLGGMSGMVASLEQTMRFEERRNISSGGKQAEQLEGTWNNKYQGYWSNWMQQNRQRQLPAHVPVGVRVLLDSERYVHRIEYLRPAPDGKSLTPMLAISFRNIELNPKLDDKKLFQYVPEPGVYVDDTTAQYIQMFQPRPAGKN